MPITGISIKKLKKQLHHFTYRQVKKWTGRSLPHVQWTALVLITGSLKKQKVLHRLLKNIIHCWPAWTRK